MLTRAIVETVLLRRTKKLLLAAELDGETCDGTNADLNDPIGVALRALGVPVASVVEVSDNDLAALPEAKLDRFLDLAELRTLENIAQSLDEVDLQVGPRNEKASQLVQQVERAIARKRSLLGVDTGTTASTPEAGAGTFGIDVQPLF